MRSINHFAFVYLAGPLLALAACRVEGYYYFPDAEDAQPPVEDWVARLGGSDYDRSGRGTSIAAAPNGDLVLVGSFKGTTLLGGAPISSAGQFPQDDIWVARYGTDGRHVWSVGMGGESIDAGTAVAVDSAGDVYVAGHFAGPVNFGGGERAGIGGFLVKLSGSSGAYVWDRTFGSGFRSASGITAIGKDGIVLAGMFTGSVNFGGGNRTSTPVDGHDCILIAFDSATGTHSWSRALTTTGDEADIQVANFPMRCNAVGLDGDVLATGGFVGTATLGGGSLISAGGRDVFVARFRGSDGGHVWSRRYGGMAHETAYALTTDGTRVFIGGTFSGTTNLGGIDLVAAGSIDALVASYNAADGAHVWSRHFGSTSTILYSEETFDVAVSPSQLAFTLSTADTVTLGGQTFNAGVVITRLDPASGEPIRAWQFENGGHMAVTYAGPQLAGHGTFTQATYLFGTPLASLGNEDIAVFRVDLDRAQ